MEINYNSPIQKLKYKKHNNTIFIKREDLLPFSFGGNKARKAKYFFEDLEEKNCDCVVTYGSSSSNHCRVISNSAAARGIPCYIITPIDIQAANRKTYNSEMFQLFDSIVIKCPISEVRVTIDKVLRELDNKGKKPYFIAGGGHGNLGTQAYVDAYEEIIDFENKFDLKFHYIFLCSGTGTTQAGLVCGSIINKDNKKIIGISNARKKAHGQSIVLESVNDYLKSIDKSSISISHITFIDDYILDGYGSYNDEIVETIHEVLINEGIPMDVTYTGKAFWGMERYLFDNKIVNSNILFIHTGGTPLFFDDMEELMNESRH